MKIILDELTPKEFFSNGGVVKIHLESDVLKKMYNNRNKFLFYEYKSYIRFMRELYLKYMTSFTELSSQEIYKQVNSFIKMYCTIGTKEYTIDPNFDKVRSLEFCNFYYCYDNDFFERTKGQNKIDVYGIKNVNFSTINVEDTNWNLFEKQRLERGFDDSELWSLDKTISGFILPRLKSFREKHSSSPKNISSQEWNNIIDKMITAFELINSDKEDISHDEYKQIECGLKLFAKHLKNLWD
jgi:hypothetical protein